MYLYTEMANSGGPATTSMRTFDNEESLLNYLDQREDESVKRPRHYCRSIKKKLSYHKSGGVISKLLFRVWKMKINKDEKPQVITREIYEKWAGSSVGRAPR